LESTLNSRKVVRFGPFELDAAHGELRKNGMRIRLQGQPFQILLVLLESPGEVVGRDALRERLWADTFVDFEHSLNTAVKKLRQVLGDNPENPTFIETVPRIGYRFIAAVRAIHHDQAGLELPGAKGGPAAPVAVTTAGKRRWAWVSVAGAATSILVAVAYWYLSRPLPAPGITYRAQLTLDGQKKDVIGTDGNRLFLNLFDPVGIGQVPISGGTVVPVIPDLPGSSLPNGITPDLWAVSPDGSSLLVRLYPYRSELVEDVDLWVVGVLGRPARLLTKAWDAAWSPDGKRILYASSHGDLYTMPSDGGEPRLLVASSASDQARVRTSGLAWSPDATKIRFTRDYTTWEVSSDGSSLHEVIPGWRVSRFTCCGRWTPDGDFYLFLSGDTLLKGINFLPGAQIWALDERRGSLRSRNPQPFQLTTGPTLWGTPIPSRDGQRIFARGVNLRGELMRFDKESRQFEPYLGGISAEFLSFSHDGRYVAYVSFPDGILCRVNRDGTGVLQLTKPPIYPKSLRWSPDDTQILFHDFSPEHQDAMYAVSSKGGTPHRLLPGDTRPEQDPNWSPDGRRVIFAAYGSNSAGPTAKPQVRILDLNTREITTLPERPGGFWSPRWSPDGRYIAGLSEGSTDLILFNLQTKQWTTMFHGTLVGFPSWSHDGRFIYFHGTLPNDDMRVYRVPLAGGKAQSIVDLRDFPWTGWYSGWFGLDPNDNPLLLRDAGTDEIYALTLYRK
jgi:Tol biopolymer transport system component/DNA-binding winged helix-turn-helix (wHTH) protein